MLAGVTNVRAAAKRVLARSKPLYRYAGVVASPVNRRHPVRAVVQTLKHDVLTKRMGRTIVVRLGDHSKILVRPGSTNAPHAVHRNPPNYEMFVWKQWLKPGDLFVDVGANIGIYTVFALDLGAEVIAVEPTPNADYLRENLALNGCTAQVVQKALSDAPGRVRMTQGLDSLNHLLLDGAGGVEVECTTLDLLLGDRVADGVKIDVEGAERLVLEGATRSLSEHRVRMLQLEWGTNRPMQTLSEGRDPVLRLLREFGYGVYWPDRRGGLHRVEGEVPPVRDVFALPEDTDPAVVPTA